MRRHEISDEQWDKIKDELPGKSGDPGQTAADNRGFINAVLWIARTGAPWRDLPERFGPWNSVFQRFNRWCNRGVWERILRVLKDPDLESLMLDSTVIRAHQHAAGALKGGGDQALGRSRGGFSTKLHIAVEAQGRPVELTLTPGQAHDMTQAEQLLAAHEPRYVIADKGYDSDPFIQTIKQRGSTPVIPARAGRTVTRRLLRKKYRIRNRVERFVNRIKQFRRVATRYEKTARNFLGFVQLAAVLCWAV